MFIVNLVKCLGWLLLLFILWKAGPALIGALAVFGMMGLVMFFVPKE